jgi:mono/diheme cytochrome c family protein
MAGGIFNTLCIACHGPDGRGTLVRPAMPPIPDFTSRDWQTSRSSSRLASSILEGKGTLMPPWNGKLTPEQARDLVLYVRSFGGPAILAADTEGEAPAALSLVEFDNRIRSLRQQFDEIEKQLQTLPAPASR